jgi:hypothetical protein
LQDAQLKQGTELTKLKDGGIDGKKPTTLYDEIKKCVESEDYKEFAESNGKKKASFKIEKAVSITSDYTGTSQVHITTRDSRVVDHPQIMRFNIRDLLQVMPADLPYIAFMEVYGWERTVDTVGENDVLPTTTFKLRESTVDAKRIGTHIPISKRMLKSVAYIVGHISRQLPAQVKYNEDFKLLFGSGAGNDPTGIFKVAPDFATVVSASITGIAGSIASVATYDGGTKAIVTFTDNQLINNGDAITIADSTNYNATYSAIVISPKKIMIATTYVAEATAAWTFTVNSQFYHYQEAAQQLDVLKVARTLVTQQEYSCTGFVLNPVDATKIELLKGSDEHYIEVTREGGILRVSGIPVVETTAMPAGKFACGDWVLAAALHEFTQLTLEFSESTTEKINNTVEAIIQEEILFPIYNKYMFIVGDFTTAIAAINKP